jgi:hypothetical protein
VLGVDRGEKRKVAAGEKAREPANRLSVLLDRLRGLAVALEDERPLAQQQLVYFANDLEVIRGSRGWLLTNKSTVPILPP